MRKLASIQIVEEVNPIPNADAIEVIRVLGWRVVVKKAENFKVGDKIVYIETDSVLPSDDERFDFLKNCNYRVKTAVFRGQVSQGLVFPLSILPEGEYNVGDEVTDILRIVKYEAPIPAQLNGFAKGGYSARVPKADETRVQTLQDIITRFKGTLFYRTEKVDGTSSAFTLEDGQFDVLGHNYSYNYDEKNVYWKMALKYDIENILRTYGKNISIKGEIIGFNIQSNKYKLATNEYRLYVFDIWDIDNARYYDLDELEKFCEDFKLPMVPVLERNIPLIDDIDTLVEMAKGMSKVNPNTKREGNVWRPMKEISGINNLGRLSFKVISPDFLIKFKE